MASPVISAGLAILRDGRLLLLHPTRAPWWRSWSIPKGLVEPGETTLEAALRETREETGLAVDPSRLDPTPHAIPYEGRDKTVVWFRCDGTGLPDTMPALQRGEVDAAGWFTREEAERRILGRLRPMLALVTGGSG